MDIEMKLKEFILFRYGSIRAFTQAADIPYSTLGSIFRRGLGNSSINNVLKVCKALGISADALAEGEIKPAHWMRPEPVEDVRDIIDEAKTRLTYVTHLRLDGHDIDLEFVEPVVQAMDLGVEMARRNYGKKVKRTE